LTPLPWMSRRISLLSDFTKEKCARHSAFWLCSTFVQSSPVLFIYLTKSPVMNSSACYKFIINYPHENLRVTEQFTKSSCFSIFFTATDKLAAILAAR
jgi:hypothetical protein